MVSWSIIFFISFETDDEEDDADDDDGADDAASDNDYDDDDFACHPHDIERVRNALGDGDKSNNGNDKIMIRK